MNPIEQTQAEGSIQLYSRAQLAELLSVSESTIRREERAGLLRTVRVRGKVRYRESDVREYLKAA
ncbi:helix-turn-helix domain-containing protein [Brevibacterium linens]|uniref:DNA binding domain-containing protein, excisionase family n=1 Tax=Brevibacterium linens TaxID=1703 RepID=A0A2H1IL09_BRELN|nr:helix-turn-helix domain-containing protein [Brevibacterium linens]SMX75868.1 DNA binding domain-containing protein, excisionase family [Brevibacterium linens]